MMWLSVAEEEDDTEQNKEVETDGNNFVNERESRQRLGTTATQRLHVMNVTITASTFSYQREENRLTTFYITDHVHHYDLRCELSF